jgi:hypothetical protein
MKTPKDARSTGRKRGRQSLFRSGRAYRCADCWKKGVLTAPRTLPPDCPKSFTNFAPGILNHTLQCNHINKNVLDNDTVNLEWLCATCHKLKDQQTSKGVSTIDDEFGYGDIL